MKFLFISECLREEINSKLQSTLPSSLQITKKKKDKNDVEFDDSQHRETEQYRTEPKSYKYNNLQHTQYEFRDYLEFKSKNIT